jgi:hypothetical protein
VSQAITNMTTSAAATAAATNAAVTKRSGTGGQDVARSSERPHPHGSSTRTSGAALANLMARLHVRGTHRRAKVLR